MTQPGGPARVQSIYYPFLLASRYGRGAALITEAEVPCYDCAVRSAVPYLDCAAVEGGDGSLNFFLVNRAEEAMELNLELPRAFAAGEHRILRGLSLVSAPCALRDGSAQALLPPRSWSMLRLRGPEKG